MTTEYSTTRQEAQESARDFENYFNQSRTSEAINYFESVQNAPADQAPMQADAGFMQTAKDVAGAVAKDVAVGVFQQGYRSVARGTIKAANNMLDFAQDVADLSPMLTLMNEEGETSYPRVVTSGEYMKRFAASKGAEPPKDNLEIPMPDAPKNPTVTSGVIESISQFITGFGVAGKAISAVKGAAAAPQAVKAAATYLQGSTVGANVAKGVAAEMLAFDAHEQRLSNVIQQVPSLQNPVTNYLAASPDDGKAEAMLKQSLEGAITGVAGEVLFRGIKAFRNGRAATQEARANGVNPEEIIGTTKDIPTQSVLGDEASADLVIKRRVATAIEETPNLSPEDVTQGAKRTPSESDEIVINFARIQSPDDVKQLMQTLANDSSLIEGVKAARRGKVSDEQLKAAAEGEDAFATLMTRRTGQALNDQQTLAARELYTQTTDRLLEAAQKSADISATSIDQFNFRKMLSIHAAVQEEVLGARAEAARALRAWSLPVGTSGRTRIKAVEDMLGQYGGIENIQDLAKRLTVANQTGALTREGINKIASGSVFARTTQAVQQLWSQGLLTSPRTHLTNISSNVLNGLYLGTERLGMAAIPDSGVKINEAVGYYVGYIGSFKEALANGAKAFRAGQSTFGSDRLEAPMVRATSREVLDPNGKAGWLSKAVDAYGYMLNRTVGGALAAGDDFGRTLLYNAELRALAVREANKLGLQGQELGEFVSKRLAEPTDFMKQDSFDFAKYGTFMQPLGNVGRAIQSARADNPLLGFVIPFVQTPANIFKFTFSRTPLGFLSDDIRADIAEGGAKGAARLAGIGLGTSIMMVGSDLAANGNITGAGPKDPSELQRLRASGWQPYSIKVGDRYYSYQKFTPFGTWLSLSASLTEILGNYENYDIAAQEQVDELVTAAGIAMAEITLSQSFMTGASELVEVLSDPGRYGENYINRLAGSFVPNLVADVEKAYSPEIEQVFSIADAVKSRIPGLSDDLPVRRNMYGEVIKSYYPDASHATATAERVARLFNPVLMSDDDRPSNKLNEFFMVNGIKSPSMPPKIQNFEARQFGGDESVAINLKDYPQIYGRFLELRGEIKPQGYNATLKDFLIDAVNGNNQASVVFMRKEFDLDAKNNFISQTVAAYDRVIRDQLLSEFPVLQQAITEEMAKMPSTPDTSQGLLRTKALP